MKLYNEDCFKVLPQLIKQGLQVDCIISDIPYNINYDKLEWDNGFDTNKILQLSEQILKPNGTLILFQSWHNVADLIISVRTQTNFNLMNWIAWDRIKGRGGTRNFTSSREDILWLVKNKKDYTFNKIYSNIPKKTKGFGEKNGQTNRSLTNVWYDISPIVPWSKERNGHPTQKPEQLMDRLVTIFSNEGDTVLDYTMGSGTTGVSAIKLGRNFIGIEQDKQWFDIAKERIENVVH